MCKNEVFNVDKKVEKGELEELEELLGERLPQEIKEHYIKYNGGYPKFSKHTDIEGEEYEVNYFLTVKGYRGISSVKELLRDVIPTRLIPFADEEGGDLFCISVRGEDIGEIYYYNHEDDGEESVTKISNSFKEFFNNLEEGEEY